MRQKQATTAYLFIGPALVFFILLFFLPLGWGFVTSLHSGAKSETFVGIDNYRRALSDPQARHSFFVTVRYATGVLVISIPLGLLLATVLNRRLKGTVIFRGILLVPYLTSIAITGLLWRNLLDPEVGIINRVLSDLGLPTQSWLNSHPLATIVGVTVWQETGYITLLFLAGLQGIPQMYYEAARVDGASPLQRFRYVTLPALAPTSLFVSVISVITALQQFALPYIITEGGPGDATDLYVYRIFETAFTFRGIGYASALAYLLLVVILIFTVIQLRVGRRHGTA